MEASTELLVSAGLAAHMRSVLVKAAIQRQVKIKFTYISHLLATEVGKFCVLVIAASMAVLIFSLADKPLTLATRVLNQGMGIQWLLSLSKSKQKATAAWPGSPNSAFN